MEDDLEVPLLSTLTARMSGIYENIHAPSASSVKDTIFIILSIYVGLGLLSQPYGVSLGGWTALGVLLGTSALFTISALLLVKVCECVPAQPPTMPTLGHILAGRIGSTIVTALATCELFGSLAVSLVILIQQFELILPSEGLFLLSNPMLSCIISILGLIGILTLRSVAKLAPLASIGSGSSAAVVIAVVSLLFIDPHRSKMPHQPPPDHSFFLWPGILQSIGIFSVSMSGHSSLPAVRSAMRNPSRFPFAVCTAFGIMAMVYSTVAAAGYYYFGSGVSPVAIYDISTNSPFTRSASMASLWRQFFAIDRILSVLVLLNCTAKVPVLIFVVQEMIFPVPMHVLADSTQYPWYIVNGYIPRVWITAAALAVALIARDSIGNVLSLIGGTCSIAVSVILPAVLYCKLYWKDIGAVRKSAVLLIGGIGVFLSVLVTSLNILTMIRS